MYHLPKLWWQLRRRFMSRRNKFLVIMLLLLLIPMLLFVLIKTTSSMKVSNKIKSTDFNNDEEIFELYKYLYTTKEYDEIYQYYNEFFKTQNATEFFNDAGFSQEETIKFISQWSSKYLIATSIVCDETVTKKEIRKIVLEVQRLGCEKEFVDCLYNQFSEEFGIFVNFRESMITKKFIKVLYDVVNESSVNESKIVFLEFIQLKYSGIHDFSMSNKIALEILKEKSKIEKSGEQVIVK